MKCGILKIAYLSKDDILDVVHNLEHSLIPATLRDST